MKVWKEMEGLHFLVGAGKEEIRDPPHENLANGTEQ